MNLSKPTGAFHMINDVNPFWVTQCQQKAKDDRLVTTADGYTHGYTNRTNLPSRVLTPVQHWAQAVAKCCPNNSFLGVPYGGMR